MFFAITSGLFLVFAIRNIFYWLYLWQIKEYRLDRLYIHITQTDQGRSLVLGWKNILKIAIFFSYFFVVFNPGFEQTYSIVIFCLYFGECYLIFREILSRRFRIPRFTFKTLIIIFITCSSIIILYGFPLLDHFFWILFIDRSIPFTIAGLIGFFSLPSDFYKDAVINRAIRKMNAYQDITKIGITGSYGKGSTKEFTATILSHEFSVVKTKGTYNTPIGIARTILTDINESTEVLVAEMGAYKIGEIREMCDIVHPNIGILTAINDQHSALFGGIKNTIRAKYELIESLPKDSIALFNGNNEIVRNLYYKYKKKKLLYYVAYDGKLLQDADIIAYDLKVRKVSVDFSVIIDGTEIGRFSAPVIGAFNIENILPGIFIGYQRGMKIGDLKKSLHKISPLSKTMEPYISNKQVVLLDDTFNANPSALKVGLDYMRIFKGKKIVVLQPMIELGNEAAQQHYEMGKLLGEFSNVVFLTNKNYFKWIKKGINEIERSCEIRIENPKNIANYINNDLVNNDVVLFEGKESANSFHLLHPQKIEKI